MQNIRYHTSVVYLYSKRVKKELDKVSVSNIQAANSIPSILYNMVPPPSDYSDQNQNISYKGHAVNYSEYANPYGNWNDNRNNTYYRGRGRAGCVNSRSF